MKKFAPRFKRNVRHLASLFKTSRPSSSPQTPTITPSASHHSVPPAPQLPTPPTSSLPPVHIEPEPLALQEQQQPRTPTRSSEPSPSSSPTSSMSDPSDSHNVDVLLKKHDDVLREMPQDVVQSIEQLGAAILGLAISPPSAPVVRR